MATMAGIYYAHTSFKPDLITVEEQRHQLSDDPTFESSWKEGVVYQVDLRSFQDSDGDGVGDIKGLIERLSYLSELGIDAIWISPIEYGNLEDLNELIQVSNEQNIEVILNDQMAFNKVWPITRSGSSQQKARLAAMRLLTVKEAPVLYYGEEIGMQNGSRAPMRWEVGHSSVAEQKHDYDSLYWLYRKLIYLRKENLSLRLGNQVTQSDAHPDILMYSRNYEGKAVWIALNMGKQVVQVNNLSNPTVHLSTYSEQSDGLALRPFEGIIWSY